MNSHERVPSSSTVLSHHSGPASSSQRTPTTPQMTPETPNSASSVMPPPNVITGTPTQQQQPLNYAAAVSSMSQQSHAQQTPYKRNSVPSSPYTMQSSRPYGSNVSSNFGYNGNGNGTPPPNRNSSTSYPPLNDSQTHDNSSISSPSVVLPPHMNPNGSARPHSTTPAPLTQLPYDVLLHICSMLRPNSIFPLFVSCKHLHSQLDNERFYEVIFKLLLKQYEEYYPYTSDGDSSTSDSQKPIPSIQWKSMIRLFLTGRLTYYVSFRNTAIEAAASCALRKYATKLASCQRKIEGNYIALPNYNSKLEIKFMLEEAAFEAYSRGGVRIFFCHRWMDGVRIALNEKYEFEHEERDIAGNLCHSGKNNDSREDGSESTSSPSNQASSHVFIAECWDVPPEQLVVGWNVIRWRVTGMDENTTVDSLEEAYGLKGVSIVAVI